ncbi:MAG TPA: GNAT family N-acetyltransferase [Roseiflexaceae bacterium]|nr:GNAT family N-acetyltransferase [Roseiflexaceae bacterium]
MNDPMVAPTRASVLAEPVSGEEVGADELFRDYSGAAVLIRAYTEADWPAICALHDRARLDELLGSCDLRAFVPLAQDQEDAENFQRSRKFVACVGGRVAGFVGVDGSYLSWLYVDPDFYGRGIGRRLLQYGKRLIGPDGWTIALENNLPARQLYASEGFRVASIFDSSNAGYPCKGVKLVLT